jgi:hypothetical protein
MTGLDRHADDRRDRLRTGARVLLALLLCVPAERSSRADDVSASEAAVKAAYVYRLSSYVAWPAPQQATSGPLVIGTLNAPDVHAELTQLLPGRKVEGREVEVRALNEEESPAACHLIFVGRGAALKQTTWRRLARAPGLLLVTEQPDGLTHGGAINFIRVSGRIRFEAAPESAERNGLKLSARLLAVAERVVTAP